MLKILLYFKAPTDTDTDRPTTDEATNRGINLNPDTAVHPNADANCSDTINVMVLTTVVDSLNAEMNEE